MFPSFGLDEAGELYFSGYGTSASLFRIVDENDDGPPAPTAIAGIGSWQDLQEGVTGVVEAIANDNGTLYVAGDFTTAGNLDAANIAAYRPGEGWSTLAAGANGRVSALAVTADGRLVAGGILPLSVG